MTMTTMTADADRKPARVAVLGAGNMGTALAQVFALGGARVVLWDFFPEVVQGINRSRRNERYLPEVMLDEKVSAVVSCAECVRGAEVVVLAVPSPFVCGAVDLALPDLEPGAIVLCAAKGIDTGSLQPIHHSVAARIGGRPLALLGGPAIANEFSRGFPTAVVLASPANPFHAAERLRPLLEAAGGWFRVRTSTDMTGVALGGILKNVYAILLGYLDAQPKAGRNLEAAALHASLHEMTALSVAMGAEPGTLYGLAGLGDLVATGFSEDSHNRRYGRALGEGRSPSDILAAIRLAPEGARTAAVACQWAEKTGVAAPLARFVQRAVAGEKPDMGEVVRNL